ncbi:hypothetical protein JHN59_13985 [Streptomyces sp. MBT49]|nr:hypothetical protein [Streptomyces sp. MBT49]
MKHEMRIEAGIEQVPGEPSTWAEHRPTGKAQITCSCGYDSGTLATADAARIASDHIGFDVTTSSAWRA